jgi:hypothetical protein
MLQGYENDGDIVRYPAQMPPHDLSTAEYEALRATIRERGSVRVCSILIGFAVWGALLIALAASDLPTAAVLAPLVVLAATFEINFFIHTGVERVGRYIQVFYEERSSLTGWETTAMNYGTAFPQAGMDPIFSAVFLLAALVNFFTSMALAGEGWNLVSLVAHLGFSYRIVRARQSAAAQRALDLDRFRQLLSK